MALTGAAGSRSTDDRARAPRRAVFLDKDGTLIDDVPYNVDVERIRFAAGARHALPALAAAGFALVVVSNQSGVARGFCTETALRQVGVRLAAMLAELGVGLDGFYWCPHHPDGVVPRYRSKCDCRKPGPGLLLRAADELGIDLAASWLVGDILDDIETGQRAGCRTVLLDNGNETEWRTGPYRAPDHLAADLASAARAILADEGDAALRFTRARAP